MALSRWQKRPLGCALAAIIVLSALSEGSRALQQSQSPSAQSTIQHLQQILATTASQAAGKECPCQALQLSHYLRKVLQIWSVLSPASLRNCAGWYYKSIEAAIFAVAASQGVSQGLSVGEHADIHRRTLPRSQHVFSCIPR